MKVKKDEIFREKVASIGNFEFGERTANVFDDMLDRSVPFYQEVQRMIGEIAADYAVPGGNIYDLGCSTCTTFLAIDKLVAPGVSFCGIDSSAAMLDKAREKIAATGLSRPCTLECADLNARIDVTNASVVILNLTLQFVRPLNRARIISAIAKGINKGGCLILVEKVVCPDSEINRRFIKYYYDFKKRNGYSELEIAQKREALENVLIPYQYDENRTLLMDNGFSACEMFFRWYNFCGMLATK